MMNRVVGQERLWITATIEGVEGRWALPPTLSPDTHTGPLPSPEIARAMGSDQVILLQGDNLPAASSARIVWSGTVLFESEHELSREQARWEWILANANAIDRDFRDKFAILRADLSSQPDNFNSARAVWSVQFYLARVRDRKTIKNLWGW